MNRKTNLLIAAVTFAAALLVEAEMVASDAAATTRYSRFETNNGEPVSNGQTMTVADDSSGNNLKMLSTSSRLQANP